MREGKNRGSEEEGGEGKRGKGERGSETRGVSRDKVCVGDGAAEGSREKTWSVCDFCDSFLAPVPLMPVFTSNTWVLRVLCVLISSMLLELACVGSCSRDPVILANLVNTRHAVMMTFSGGAAQLTNMSHSHGSIRVTSKPLSLQACQYTPIIDLCSGNQNVVQYDRRAEAHRVSTFPGMRAFKALTYISDTLSHL